MKKLQQIDLSKATNVDCDEGFFKIPRFTLFPDVRRIKDMINTYTLYNQSPIAYTLDIGINDKGTFIIEIHDFFSCGLYGFANHSKLPFMFYRWFHEYIK